MGAERPPRALEAIGRTFLRIPRAWAWVPASAWAGLIWYVSSRPLPSIGATGAVAGVVSNFAHAPEFGMLALLLALLAPRSAAFGGWPELSRGTRFKVLLVVVAYAISDEVHQSFTPHRDPSAFDVLTDATGAFSTLACIALAAGPRASAKGFARAVVLGLAACLAAATAATFVPDLFPEAPWL